MVLAHEPSAVVGAIPVTPEAHRLDVLESDLLHVVEIDRVVDVAVAVQLVEAHRPAAVELPGIGRAIAELEAIHLRRG